MAILSYETDSTTNNIANDNEVNPSREHNSPKH